MKIAIVNPSSAFSKNVVRDVIYGCWCKGKRIGGATVLPYWLIMLATILKESKQYVSYLDLNADDFLPSDYDVLIINTSSMSFNEDVKFVDWVKSEKPSIKSIFFGSHPHYMPNYCLEKSNIDFIVRGEPEFVIRDLIEKLERNEDYSELPGIAYIKNGKNHINPLYPYIEDLDSLPYLDDSFIPDLLYFNPLIRKYPYISMVTSRGCPGACTFCPASSFYGKSYRWQSVERVVSEMEFHKSRGYKEIYFRDETFTFSKTRTKEICLEILKRDLKIGWICNARVGTLDEETIALMKKSGCHWIKFGVESGDQRILDNVKKGINLKSVRETFQWTRKLGMDTHTHFMLGMPGENETTIKSTIDFAISLNPTTATFGICTPYPGTALFNDIAKKHPEIQDGSEVDFSSLHTQGFFNEEFTELNIESLNKYVHKAYKSFYLRPRYLLAWIFRLRNYYDFKRVVLSGLKIFDFILRGD